MELFASCLLLTFTPSFVFGFEANNDGGLSDAGHDVVEPRIIGGSLIEITQAPYMAAVVVVLLDRRFFVCGSSILSPFVVLTTAHCLDVTKRQLWVSVGHKSWSKGELVKVSRRVPHDQYENVSHSHDVALLFLSERLPMGDRVQAVQLSLDGHPPDRAGAFVSGWGKTHCASSFDTDLKGLNVAVHPDEDCIKIKGDDYFVGDHLCAGNLGRPTDEVYIGDSGDPLVYNNTQIGIQSKTQCKLYNPNYLSSYASVIHHRWWIVNKTTEFVREKQIDEDLLILYLEKVDQLHI